MGRSHDLLTLFRLACLHWRAAMRKQFRRVRTPSGCIFSLFGTILIVGWLGLIMFGPGMGSTDLGPIDAAVEGVDLRLFYAQLFLAAFGFLSVMGALNAKGLYLPKAEVHALLSAPISTPDLVRYRLLVDCGKTALSAVIFVALFWGRLPTPGYGVFGILLALFVITITSRVVSLALGNTNLRIGRLLRGRALGRAGFLIGILVWALMMGHLVSTDIRVELFGGEESISERVQAMAQHPVLVALLLPLRPFAELVVAETAPEFLTWLAVDVALLVLVFELCARSAGEIREATMTTSEELAKRIGAMRKGQSSLFAMGRADRKGKRLRRFPRVFGEGRTGTVAWARCVGITRFSLTTTLIGLVVVGFVVMISMQIDGGAKKQILGSSAMITALGTMYLGATMRFDFRSSLSRMESIKSWPIPAGRLFFATVLPQALLMTLLLLVGVLVRIPLREVFHPILLPCLLLIPGIVYAWVSLDNAVFLFFPVKFIPGQDGAVHHIGRSLMLIFLRLFLLAIAGGAMGLVILLLGLAAKRFEWDSGIVESAAPWILFIGILGACLLFTFAGGVALRRYDVSRSVS